MEASGFIAQVSFYGITVLIWVGGGISTYKGILQLIHPNPLED